MFSSTLGMLPGEDRGEAGVLKAQSNATLCLDLANDRELPVMPQPCKFNFTM